MIEFSDITIRESGGHYLDTCRLMDEEIPDNKWMIISNALVASDILVSTFVLYFFYDGRVVIFEAHRPIEANVPDSDLRDLHDWCIAFGWKRLDLHDRLLENVRHYEYWMRLYQTGVIYNHKLEAKDLDIMAKLSVPSPREEDD